MTFGTRLRKCREKERLSQKEVAEHLGVSQSTYCNWESDVASYQVKYLPLLAQLFEVAMGELIPNSHITKTLLRDSQGGKHADNHSAIAGHNQLYADWFRSKEEIIQLLKDENNRLKALIKMER